MPWPYLLISKQESLKLLNGAKPIVQSAGLENNGNNCYQNSILHLFYYTKSIANFIDEHIVFPSCDNNPRDCLQCVIKVMLNEMASGGKLTTYLMDQNLLTDVAGFKPEECQDAHDFLMRLLKSLELCYKSKIYEASGAHLSPSIADLQIGPLEYLKNLSIEVTYTCGHCGTKKKDLQSHSFLLIPIKEAQIESLEDILVYLKTETVVEDLKCPTGNCERGLGKVTKKADIVKYPPILIILTTRFFQKEMCSLCEENPAMHSACRTCKSGTFMMQKDTRFVATPPQLHLRDVADPLFEDEGVIYNHRSSILHKGVSIISGHFYNISRHASTYILYDDEDKAQLGTLQAEKLLGQQGYMAVYEMNDASIQNMTEVDDRVTESMSRYIQKMQNSQEEPEADERASIDTRQQMQFPGDDQRYDEEDEDVVPPTPTETISRLTPDGRLRAATPQMSHDVHNSPTKSLILFTRGLWNTITETQKDTTIEEIPNPSCLTSCVDHFAAATSNEVLILAPKSADSDTDSTVIVFSSENMELLLAMHDKLQRLHETKKREKKTLSKGSLVSVKLDNFFVRGVIQKKKFISTKKNVYILDMKTSIEVDNKNLRVLSRDCDETLRSKTSASEMKLLNLSGLSTLKKNDVFKKLAMRKTKICQLEDKIQLEDQEESILLDIMSQGVDELESKWLKIVQGAKINYVKQVPTKPEEGYAFQINSLLGVDIKDGYR